MDEKIKLVVDQFSIQAGNWQQNPAHLRVIDAATNKFARGRGNLYILVEVPQGSIVPQAFYGDLTDTIVDTYYTASGSITRGLRAAVLAANDLLFQQNLRADSEHRVFAGLNCALVRGSEVYIAQAGPALANLVHQGELQRFPSDSIWLRSESPSTFDLNREPLAGLRRDIEPNLFHTNLTSGDVLILSSTSLARLAAPGDIVNAITCTGSESARGNLEALASGRDLSALLIEYPGDRQPVLKPGARPTTSPSVPSEESHPAPSLEREVAATISTRQEPEATLAPDLPEESLEPTAQAEELAGPDEYTASDRGYQGVEAERAAPEAPLPQRPRIDLGAMREGLSQGTERLRRGAGEMLMRVLPDTVPEPPLPQPERSQPSLSLSGRALVFVALAIPLIMLFLVIMARIQYDRTLRQQFTQVQAMAQARFEQAMNITERTEQRKALYEALTSTEEGLAIRPTDETLNEVKRRIYHQLDKIDLVTRLFHFWQLAELDTGPTSPTDAARVVINNFDVFLVNHGGDRVFKYMLNDVGDALQPVEKTAVLLQKGEVRGGAKVGDLVDITWLEAGGQRSLSTFIALDRSGSLLTYEPNQGIDVLPVANSDTWLKPQAIGGYQGNLYVLDPLLNRILKYTPTDNAYTTPPGDYLSPALDVDLAGAVDMAIDGNLYILFADGQIKKFYKGEPQPFTMASLPTPMRSPTVIFVSGKKKPDAAGYVYVADTGNERILQFDKAGNFLRQFQANPGELQLKNLRGLFVDEDKSRIFVLSGKTLWLCELPRLGSEPQ